MSCNSQVLALTPVLPKLSMQPESSDGFASVGTILPKEGAALLPGGSFRFCPTPPSARTAAFNPQKEVFPERRRCSARAGKNPSRGTFRKRFSHANILLFTPPRFI